MADIRFKPAPGTVGKPLTMEDVSRMNRLRAETAEEELSTCRALLDSYGFHQIGIHNGITAMQNRILKLESLLKSYD